MTKPVKKIKIPKGYIVIITGVPGSGKTTLSYELWQKFDEFRLVEETDIVREVIRGYTHFLQENFQDECYNPINLINITQKTKHLTYDELLEQCNYFQKSIEYIILRQKRKGIASIINGVHMMPETLIDISDLNNVVFINLFFSNTNEIVRRLKEREGEMFSEEYIPSLIKKNRTRNQKFKEISLKYKNKFFCIDVCEKTLSQSVNSVIECILMNLNSTM